MGSLCWSWGLADQYQWSIDTPTALRAPTDLIVEGLIQGACLQGGLLDLRFGQASVEVQGVGHILDWNDSSRFTLDALPSSAKELAQIVKDGESLTVAVRYNPKTSLIGWMDAVSSQPVPAVSTKVAPEGILTPGQELRVAVPKTEVLRLGLSEPKLRIPGICRNLPLVSEPGAFVAYLPVLDGWEWRDLPIFIGQGEESWFRSTKVTISSQAPTVTNYGPEAGGRSVRCWIEYDGPAYLLDARKTRISVTPQARIENLVHRPGRVDFRLELPESGRYAVQATLLDTLGRRTQAQWTLSGE